MRDCVTRIEGPGSSKIRHIPQENESVRPTPFAQIASAINQSKTVTWTAIGYMSWTSKDGKRTWLQAESRTEMAYQAPNLYRDTRYDRKGNVLFVQIVDATNNKTLQLDMKSKQAMWMDQPINVYGPGHPLAGLVKILDGDQLDFIGQREIDRVKVDVYRHLRKPNQTSMDIWLDANTKCLAGISIPGTDKLDPTAVAEVDDVPPRRERGSGRMAGFIRSDIVLDAPLNEQLFSMVPPEGFELVEAPPRPGANVVK
jgi:outer membrane lipoprotein-sorting protein